MTSSFFRTGVVAFSALLAGGLVCGGARAQDFSRPSSGPHSGPSSGPASGPQSSNSGVLDEHHALVTARFPTPEGFRRVETSGFGAWLRRRVILPESTPVRRFDGEKVAAPWNRGVVDVGFIEGKDLQQCADSALRLYAEYVRTEGSASTLSFHATSGDEIQFARYEKGERVVVKGKGLAWKPIAGFHSRTSFDELWAAWLEDVFTYAGSISLAHDTDPVNKALRPGDLLVLPGSPGHVVVVMDVAEDLKGTGRQQLLLGQGFMPAQTFHMLGWFSPADDGSVTVPSWPKPFDSKSRRRFK